MALQTQELAALIEYAPDNIIRYDSDMRVTLVNRQLLVTTGISREKLLGRRVDQLLCKNQSAMSGYFETLSRVLASGLPEDYLLETDTGFQGRPLVYSIRFAPEFAADGKVAGAIAIGRNISEIKAAERKLQESSRQLQALLAQIEETREDERRRIARELHDELGQRLTALRLDLSRLRLRFGMEQPSLAEQVREMVAEVDATIQVVRSVVVSLRPPVLDMGIAAALEWLVSDFGKRTGICCQLKVPDTPVAMDDHWATAVFRIVQESLTNAARHAQAQNVKVTLAYETGFFCLEVNDDGCGFDPLAGPKSGSFGLIGIAERVRILGGALNIDAVVGQGVKLSVQLPAGLLKEPPVV